MQVKWLAKALQNLEGEAEFIALDDPVAAQQVIQRVFDAVEKLHHNPALGHPGRIHGTRELVVPNTRLIIPYRVKPRLGQVEILRVFQTSRRSPKRS